MTYCVCMYVCIVWNVVLCPMKSQPAKKVLCEICRCAIVTTQGHLPPRTHTNSLWAIHLLLCSTADRTAPRPGSQGTARHVLCSAHSSPTIATAARPSPAATPSACTPRMTSSTQSNMASSRTGRIWSSYGSMHSRNSPSARRNMRCCSPSPRQDPRPTEVCHSVIVSQ